MRQPRSVYDARWKARHPDYKPPTYPEKQKEYYRNNREKLLARAQLRYDNMTDEERVEHNRKRRERHAKRPEVRNSVERRRDHQKRSGGPFRWFTWEIVKMKYGNVCIYCGSGEKITIEHRKPVSLGGDNSFHNLAPACLSCNSGKKNKTEVEYREWRRARGLYIPPVSEVVYDW